MVVQTKNCWGNNFLLPNPVITIHQNLHLETDCMPVNCCICVGWGWWSISCHWNTFSCQLLPLSRWVTVFVDVLVMSARHRNKSNTALINHTSTSIGYLFPLFVWEVVVWILIFCLKVLVCWGVSSLTELKANEDISHQNSFFHTENLLGIWTFYPSFLLQDDNLLVKNLFA